jgi:hypothetical protein
VCALIIVEIDGTRHSLAPAAFHFNRKEKRLPARQILYSVKSAKSKPDFTGYYRKIKKKNQTGLLEKSMFLFSDKL